MRSNSTHASTLLSPNPPPRTSRYCFQGVVLTQFAHRADRQAVLSDLGFDTSPLTPWTCLAILVGFCLFFMLMVYRAVLPVTPRLIRVKEAKLGDLESGDGDKVFRCWSLKGESRPWLERVALAMFCRRSANPQPVPTLTRTCDVKGASRLSLLTPICVP